MQVFLRAFIAFAGTLASVLLLFELWTVSSTQRLATQPIFDGSPGSSLEELRRALRAMQDSFFQLWIGTWPSAIDWTAAVMGTHVSASLYSLSRSLDYSLPAPRQPVAVTAESHRVENEINKYFSQAVSYYFGQDAFGLRAQAYDDMLWVVLGWLENIRFIDLHGDAHYQAEGETWHGKQFTEAFAHRARIFYDLAKRGWDTSKCGGGMFWNPRLLPYKNAITNELFVSASIAMYLDFPGDGNSSPFSKLDTEPGMNESVLAARPHSREYLKNAVKAYDWLVGSNMKNYQGLYVDGFHISHRNGRYICDIRNEMVYSYNQGVVLSGVRGLWESTNKTRYLEDGYRLVDSVIAATGFNLSASRPFADSRWQGLGRAGILEDLCDPSGHCSQDGQNFKGIFMHHLTHFCEPLPSAPRVPGVSFAAEPALAARHRARCARFTPWVVHNAQAALATKDARGFFGMWWGAGLASPPHHDQPVELPFGAEDYRNRGLGDARRWGRGWKPVTAPPPLAPLLPPVGEAEAGRGGQAPMGGDVGLQDVNDRGRGRTVETQGAGVAVVRALWEFLFEHNRV